MKHSRFVPLGCMLANAAALHTIVLVLVDLTTPQADQAGLLIWWGCLSGAWLGLNWFLRRARPVRWVVVILVAVFALQLGLTLWSGWRSTSFISWVLLLAFWGVGYYSCWSFLHKQPSPEQVMLTFETTAFTLLMICFFVSTHLMAPEAMVHLALATLLALAALGRQRVGAPRAKATSSTGSKALLWGALALLGGITALAAALFTQGLGKGVQWLEQALRSAAGVVFHAVEQFLLFLSSFLPEEEWDSMDSAGQGGGMPTGNGGGEDFFLNLDWLLYVMVGLALLAILILLVHTFRNSGHRHSTMALKVRTSARRSGGGLGALWRRWKGALALNRKYLRLRNTPMGLLLWLERRLGRKAGESPRAFLDRCAVLRPHCASDLARLADWLDQYYFAPHPPTESLPVANMRKNLKKKDC